MIVLYEDREPVSVHGVADGDALWLETDALRQATGWELRAEGACRGDVCVPLARGVDGTRVDLAALAEAVGQPVVRDPTHAVWSVGFAPAARRTVTASPSRGGGRGNFREAGFYVTYPPIYATALGLRPRRDTRSA